MPRKTFIESHLTLEELRQRIRRTKQSVTRQQLRVIYWMLRGKTQKEVALKTGYSTAWVHAIVRRYNTEGPDSLRDHRRENQGRPYRLSKEVRDEMRAIVSRPPAGGGMWTGPLLVEWVRARIGDQDIDNKRGWEWLCQMNCKNRLRRKRTQRSDEKQTA
jgi:transposase